MNWLPGMPSVSVAGRDGQQRLGHGPLDERGHEHRVDQVHVAVGAREVVGGDEPRERQHVREGRLVAVALERGHDGHARATHRGVALAAHRHDLDVAAGVDDVAHAEADGVGVERSGEAAIGGEQHDQAGAHGPLAEQRMLVAVEDRGEVREDLVQLVPVGPRLEGRVLGTLQLRGSHELHRTGDLLDVLHRPDAASDLALAGHELVSASCVGRCVRSRGTAGRRRRPATAAVRP